MLGRPRLTPAGRPARRAAPHSRRTVVANAGQQTSGRRLGVCHSATSRSPRRGVRAIPAVVWPYLSRRRLRSHGARRPTRTAPRRPHCWGAIAGAHAHFGPTVPCTGEKRHPRRSVSQIQFNRDCCALVDGGPGRFPYGFASQGRHPRNVVNPAMRAARGRAPRGSKPPAASGFSITSAQACRPRPRATVRTRRRLATAGRRGGAGRFDTQARPLTLLALGGHRRAARPGRRRFTRSDLLTRRDLLTRCDLRMPARTAGAVWPACRAGRTRNPGRG